MEQKKSSKFPTVVSKFSLVFCLCYADIGTISGFMTILGRTQSVDLVASSKTWRTVAEKYNFLGQSLHTRQDSSNKISKFSKMMQEVTIAFSVLEWKKNSVYNEEFSIPFQDLLQYLAIVEKSFQDNSIAL